MLDSFFHLRRTGGINTACSGLSFHANNRCAADRTGLRHVEFFFDTGSLGQNDFDNFGNNIACPLHQDRVSKLNVFFFNLVLIVQSGPADGYAAYAYRS